MSQLNRKFVVLGGVLAIVFGATASTSIALASYCDQGGMGRAGCIGFFTGDNGGAYEPSGCRRASDSFVVDVHNVLPNGLAVGSATEFINTVSNNLYDSSTQKRRGGAFIVHAILGKGAAGNVQWAKDNFDEFKTRVNEYGGGGSDYGIRWNVSRTSPKNSAYFGCIEDDAFHEDGGSAAVIEFYWSGGSLQIERNCGNLRGGTAPPEQAKEWTIDQTTTIDKTTAEVGDIVTWTHTVTNDGPDETDKKVDYTINGTPTNPSANTGNLPTGSAKDTTKQIKKKHTVVAADAGKTFCQNITVDPKAWNSNAPDSSSEKCFTVPFDYELNPGVTLNPDDHAESGSTVRVTPEVANAGPTDSGKTRWELHQLVFAPDVTPAPSAGGSSVSGACVYFATSDSCALASSGDNRVFTVTPNPNILPTSDRIIGSLAVGSKVCFSLSIKPWKQRPSVSGGSDWLHSELACIVVSKKPKLHVEGGDLRVRGRITTSLSSDIGSPKRTYGSWIDYGVFSTDLNDVAGSGGGLRGGHASSNSSSWSKLTFASSSSPYGGFALSPALSPASYFARLAETQTAAAGSSITLSGGGKNIIKISGTGNITINASALIGAGETFVIQSAGTVTIAGDITYDETASLGDIKQIPQVVIVANNINIQSGVQRVDAWLLASGSIDTCSNKPAGNLTINRCKEPLTVNGPVVTNELHALRTAGATKDQPEVSAETFRLRSDAYLWAYRLVNSVDRAQTVYVTELPPRF